MSMTTNPNGQEARFIVWGYTDDRPEKVTELARYNHLRTALARFRSSWMATEVEDSLTGQIFFRRKV